MKTRRRLIRALRVVHGNSPVPFMVFDAEHTILEANEAFLRSFNLTHQDLGKKKTDFLLYPGVNGSSLFSAVAIKELFRESFLLVYQAEGMETTFHVNIFPLGTLRRQPAYYAVMRDVSVMESQFVDKSLHALIKASLLKDNDTSRHLDRVNAYSRQLAEYLFARHHEQLPEINRFFIEKIAVVAALHDIGKIGTPDSILTKKSSLTDEEFDIIKQHTINGAFILSSLAGEMARDVALFHHERWDGTGYPYSLKEHDIPLSARIVALADVYDALRMPRYYKNSFSHEEAKTVIVTERGGYFDPLVVDAFLGSEQEFSFIFHRYAQKLEADRLEELSAF